MRAGEVRWTDGRGFRPCRSVRRRQDRRAGGATRAPGAATAPGAARRSAAGARPVPGGLGRVRAGRPAVRADPGRGRPAVRERGPRLPAPGHRHLAGPRAAGVPLPGPLAVIGRQHRPGRTAAARRRRLGRAARVGGRCRRARSLYRGGGARGEPLGDPGSAARALGASALLRGAYHLYQGYGGFAGNLVLGLLFGRVYQRRGRTTPLVVAHFLIDSAAGLGYLALRGKVSWLPG